MHDVIYVLMMTYGSIANLKCELILHSKNVLEKILNTITFDYVSLVIFIIIYIHFKIITYYNFFFSKMQ